MLALQTHQKYSWDFKNHMHRGSLPDETFGSWEKWHKSKIAFGKYLTNVVFCQILFQYWDLATAFFGYFGPKNCSEQKINQRQTNLTLLLWIGRPNKKTSHPLLPYSPTSLFPNCIYCINRFFFPFLNVVLCEKGELCSICPVSILSFSLGLKGHTAQWGQGFF